VQHQVLAHGGRSTTADEDRGLAPTMNPVRRGTGTTGPDDPPDGPGGRAAGFTRAREPRADRADRSPQQLQDALLAGRASRDPEAFGDLYDRYCDQIYRFCYRRLRDREVAEDATADVFFKALRAIASYDAQVAPFSAWLYKIASNVVADQLRARRPVNSLEAAMDAPDRSEPVEQQALNRVEVDRVWGAIDQLSGAQRTAVILRHGHGLALAEIAAKMERSEGAVKLLLNRGLRSVRERLSGYPVPTREGGVQ
jgi:RNA polymerase sigma-70 factor, ECF subfamily